MLSGLTTLFKTLKRQPFPRERLTIRILADVDDVDPSEDVSELFEGAPRLPPINLVAEWFVPKISAQLCIRQDDGSLQWLTEGNIDSWGIGREELFEIAVGNLNASTANAKLHKVNADGGSVYSPLCEGVFPSSLILAGKLFSDFNFDREDLIAAIPNRDSLYFCTRSSLESVKILHVLSNIAWEDEDCPRKYRITKCLLVPNSKAAFGWALQN